jgi:XRE family transcriptional regulator, regulator of sulfur utilization
LITRRDMFVALAAAAATLGVVAGAQTQKAVMRSTLFDWNAVTPQQTEYGARRQFFKSATATTDELSLHVTTVNPGSASHAPHRHAHEEMFIVKEGTVEALVGGEWKRVGPGSAVFCASNELHGIRNAGTSPATYHVINWHTPATKALQPPPGAGKTD